jgi:DNA relaxase NicK
MAFAVGIDYLALTVRGTTVQEVCEQLGASPCERDKGYRGYPVSYLALAENGAVALLGTGAAGRPTEVHADVPASFLASWGYARLQALAQWVRDRGHLTRVDLAFDDRLGVVTVATVRAACERGQAITHFRLLSRIDTVSLERRGDRQGDTLTIGSRQSQTFLRIYDKALEQKRKGKDIDGPWVRWELELKEERADKAGQALASLEEEAFRRFMVGVLRAAIEFKDTNWEADPMVRHRAAPLPWWIALTEGFQQCRLTVQPVVRTLEDVKQWVNAALAPMLAVMVCAPSAGEQWLREVIAAGSERWKAKHYALLHRQPPKREYRLRPC